MQPVAILAIAGSPRRGGNTETLLDEAIKGAESLGARVEKLVLRDFQIGPCLEIYACEKTAECVLKDDYHLFYEKFLAVDRIIFASPVFFFGVHAQAKALIDRCQCFWIRKYVMKKRIPPRGSISRKGFLLSAGGYKSPTTFEGLRKVMKFFYLTLDMEYAAEVCAHAVDAKGDILTHPDALKAAFELGLAAAAPQ